MESFAEYLKQYLSKQNITFSQAAKMSGIERSILSRYAKGSRKPQNMEVVTKLADGLQMSELERTEFYNIYKRMIISQEYGVNDDTLVAVLGEKYEHEMVDEEMEPMSEEMFSEEFAQDLHSKMAIVEAIRYVLKDAKFAKMHFTPGNFTGADNFMKVFSQMRNVPEWEHILCLKHRDWKYGQERMDILLSFLPYLFQDGKMSVYYHYRRESGQDRQQIKTQYLLTDKGIVFFDKELRMGFFSNQKIPCEFYGAVFDEEKKKCRVFAEGGQEQFMATTIWQPDMVYQNPDTGSRFLCQKEAVCIWMVNTKEQAICIRETGVVQVLWRFIWDKE